MDVKVMFKAGIIKALLEFHRKYMNNFVVSKTNRHIFA